MKEKEVGTLDLCCTDCVPYKRRFSLHCLDQVIKYCLLFISGTIIITWLNLRNDCNQVFVNSLVVARGKSSHMNYWNPVRQVVLL